MPVEPTPTLTFSIRTLSPTAKGKLFAVLNPTDKVTNASLVAGKYSIVLIPTPESVPVGMIVGVTLESPLVFLRILISELPRAVSYTHLTLPTTPYV